MDFEKFYASPLPEGSTLNVTLRDLTARDGNPRTAVELTSALAPNARGIEDERRRVKSVLTSVVGRPDIASVDGHRVQGITYVHGTIPPIQASLIAFELLTAYLWERYVPPRSGRQLDLALATTEGPS